MAPEYCMSGLISSKSDVYSFGVVLLEIISGKENAKFCREIESGYSLLIYIWELWRAGRSLELVDEAVAASCDSNQNLVRFINIGLLCVQESAEDRPSMSDVLHMLESTANMPLPVPKKPPCYEIGNQPNLEASQQSTILDHEVGSNIELTPR
ncbi:hypothetical protein QYF36_011457 [Acer negundo]|nr:hypothetical protein QYF36_011457 [Acer negundo]